MSPKPVLGPEIQDSRGPSWSFHTNSRTEHEYINQIISNCRKCYKRNKQNNRVEINTGSYSVESSEKTKSEIKALKLEPRS